MRHASAIILGAFLFCLALAAGPAQAQSYPERGRAAVVDAAGVIPDEAEAALDARIIAWSRRTGHRLAVATVPSLEGRTVQDYAVGLFRHWGLGDAEANDGVLLLVVPVGRPGERDVRIEVGYGLEGVLTDALSGRIIRETIRPALLGGDVAGGIDAGVEQIMETIEPSAPPAPPPPQSMAAEPEGVSGAGLMIGFLISGLIVFGIIWLVVRAGRRRESGATGGVGASGPDSRADLDAMIERRRQDMDDRGSYDSGDYGVDGGGGSSGGGGADERY